MKRMMIVMMLQQQLLPLESHDNRSSGALLGGTRACMKQSVLATCWPGVCIYGYAYVCIWTTGDVYACMCVCCVRSAPPPHIRMCAASPSSKNTCPSTTEIICQVLGLYGVLNLLNLSSFHCTLRL